MSSIRSVLLFLFVATAVFGAGNRYALILKDPPAISKASSRENIASDAVVNYRRQLLATHASVKAELQARHFVVTGEASTVLNAIFVAASPARLDELRAIPGVLGVVLLGRSKMLLNKATALLNGPQAWALFGGLNNAGTGVKIAIVDTGIDQTHPAFQDSTLPMPAGFPKCDVASNCANFTNNKVIAARSYVSIDAAGQDPANPAATSAPDDLSARDRVGHGTAVATAAAGYTATLAVTINGMAPKAYLGNYKIAGSPNVNDGASNAAMIQAIDDAVNDGMDIVTTSFGGSATTGPLDTGVACGNTAGVPCDPLAFAYEQAAQEGVVVLAAAGNSGDGGNYGTGAYPSFNSIGTPADAPSVIAVGAVSNTHTFNPDVEATGAGVPSNLNSITASFTDASSPPGAYTAPLVDLTQIGDSTGLGCSALPASSLVGDFALIERGSCNFSVKMQNATDAGALGVVFYDNSSEALINPSGLTSFDQPVLFISLTDGQNLKTFIDSHPRWPVTLNPSAVEVPVTGGLVITSYSSFGPALGTNAIKPDVLAVGGGSSNGDLIYMGAQDYDPLGILYSSVRFVAAAGTSFATPLAAGSAALVKQAHPGYSGLQIKSALVNTTSQAITMDDGGPSGTAAAVNILQTGAGLIQADQAVQTNVTIVPSSVSFGSLASGPVSQSQTLTFTNTGNASVNLGLAVATIAAASGTSVAVAPASLALAPGASGHVVVTLSGSIPSGGLYDGSINVTGANVALRIPYLFLSPVFSGAVNLTAVFGDSNSAVTNQVIPDGGVGFQLVDANGVPVAGVPVTFSVDSTSSPVTLSQVSTVTDSYGYAYATVTTGSTVGQYVINATADGQKYQFTGTIAAQPTVTAAGVVNAATFTAPIAPGSYVSIFGTNLSAGNGQNYSVLHLPLSINSVTVSFDAPATGSLPAISVPGYLVYVSPNQVNVQVPWELQGYSSAQVKVTEFGTGFGNVVSIPLAAFAPGIFEVAPGQAAALDANSQLISSSNAAARGSYISLYANGLGPVTNQPPSGDPALSSPLSRTNATPSVSIGGVQATVIFSGLAPGFPALYQVNVQIPPNTPTGNQPVQLSIGGVAAKTTYIYVK